MRFKDVRQMKESTLKRFLRLPRFEEHLELHRLDCIAAHGWLENYEFVRRKLQELTEAQLKPAPLVTGHDLIAVGHQPGPQFSRMLAAVEDAQLEGRIQTKEEGLELVREMFPI
jgi:poly(A) polymerase